MGVKLKEILTYEEIDIKKISNKKIAIDAHNMLYQFLSNIRQNDGNFLTDSKGNITSHLKGIFNRCIYFKKNNIKAAFIFDGKAPKLKEKERKLRYQKKIEADKKYKEALNLGLVEEAKKFLVQSTNILTKQLIEESKYLIKLFGFPVIEAPSEGEAQGAKLVSDRKVWALSSQDFDSLLMGTKILIRNLSVSTRRKIPGTQIYKNVSIEKYDLKENLKKLNINQEQLIYLGILCGTDFNPGGIKGIGPKKALKLVQQYNDRWDEMFKILDWYSYFPFSWIEVYNTFKKMPVKEITELEFKNINRDEIIKFLEKKDFDKEQIKKSLDKTKENITLDKFF